MEPRFDARETDILAIARVQGLEKQAWRRKRTHEDQNEEADTNVGGGGGGGDNGNDEGLSPDPGRKAGCYCL